MLDITGRLRRRFDATTLAAALLSACGAADDEGTIPPELIPESMLTPVHWTYEGPSGPDHWGSLDAAFAMCSDGGEQSPIDILTSIPAGILATLEFDYAPTPATILDNGHTIQVNLPEGANMLRISGEDYSLLQFHFHAHSEHALDSEHKPLEMHLVHRSANGELAVVGVLLDLGTSNEPLARVFDAMASAGRDAVDLGGDVDPFALLPSTKRGWTYSGSLTTPPCSEGVRWHVLSEVLTISEPQLAAFLARHPVSRRPLTRSMIRITGGN